MFLKNKNIIFKIRRSKFTDYAALIDSLSIIANINVEILCSFTRYIGPKAYSDFIYNIFCKSLDEGKEVRAVFCDISNAFDRLWHRGLLFKLKSIGVSDSLLVCFKCYLADRKQRVVLPGAVSAWKYIKAGVPQGSILGLLLFLIYINDIVVDIHSRI